MTKFTDNLLTIDSLSEADREVISAGLRRGATRREVMSWLVAGGATIAAAGSILSSAKTVLAATPKKGGRIKFAADAHGPADNLDPAKPNGSIDYTRGRAHFNGLCQFNDDLSTRPELAEEYSANGDSTEWTFKIRKGVKFHDNSPLTADDVLYSMRRHSGEKSTSTAKTLVSNLKEWVKIDNHTVKAVLKSPNADLPSILATSHFKIIRDGESNFQNPAGTGPYKLKEFKPGVRSLHVRNDDYWRDGGNAEEIEIFAITDKLARTSALLSGDIDLMMSLDPKAVNKIEATAGVGVWSVPSGSYLGICCMANTAPGNNRDFVLAMKYIQRRSKIVKSILKGQGTVGNDHPIGAAYGVDHCTNLVQRKHDLDKAKFHLKKSGVTEAVINVAEVRPGLTDMCLLAQQEAKKIGLDLKIKTLPTDGYWGAVWRKTPVNVVGWNMRPTANIMLNIAFAPDAPWNDTKWKDERMSKWLLESRVEKDPAQRHEIYCAMQTLINEESGMVIPAHLNTLDAKSDKIQGIGRVPLGALGGFEWPEFAWRTDV